MFPIFSELQQDSETDQKAGNQGYALRVVEKTLDFLLEIE